MRNSFLVYIKLLRDLQFEKGLPSLALKSTIENLCLLSPSLNTVFGDSSILTLPTLAWYKFVWSTRVFISSKIIWDASFPLSKNTSHVSDPFSDAIKSTAQVCISLEVKQKRKRNTKPSGENILENVKLTCMCDLFKVVIIKFM